jgi:hypothetical protein
MKQLLQFKANDGTDLYIEVGETAASNQLRGGSGNPDDRGVIESAQHSFDKALQPLNEISNSIINCIKNISHSPQEVEVELGLKFTAKAGIILTSLDSEAHLKVTLKWKNEKVDG